ncbi:MAG: Dihydroxyacetone kinase 2 [Sclerophora amabilis]|nr:MAG: Dihydroxyacetone kinase 2 [Sclerophora amabilis]
MALVVEQTLPFPASQLELENPERWSRIFPLIRPSVTKTQSKDGHNILVDKSLLKNGHVQIAAIGSTGNFPSKLLSARQISSFATQASGRGNVNGSDIAGALNAAGANPEDGLVVVKASSKRHLEIHSDGKLAEVEVEGELELDHLLSLLIAATSETQASIDRSVELIKIFLKTAATTTTTFDTQKLGSNPSVKHVAGSASFDSAKASVQKDLKSALKSNTAQEGSVTYSVHYADINGLSRLENYLLAHEISDFLVEQNLPFYITSSTVLDVSNAGRGWSISICPVPQTFVSPQKKPRNALTKTEAASKTIVKPRETTSPIRLTDQDVRRRLVNGCETVIKEEPTITEYDTIVGDGDCGYTLRDGAKQVLGFISNQNLAELPQSLSALVDDLEVNMGGTSGALYCIFLSSLAQSLWDAKTFADALVTAQTHLLKYTRARLGDRTMLDCLIPFVDTWKTTGNVDQALQEAAKGVEGTKKLEAKLGRSTYLDESATQGVPDPGAYGLLKLLEGIAKA